jgi:glycosyltransferase involved in cell wall biosynthesis
VKARHAVPGSQRENATSPFRDGTSGDHRKLTSDANPVVSVIGPARNEQDCLALCLESLVSQTGIAFELIVVDDASTDRTAEIARSFSASPGVHARPNVTVISAPPLPDNWTGKNNAMSAGAKVAKGKWLLFTDADTVHKPRSLVRAVAEAEQHGAALLSYSPEQEVHGFWEKAVMPVIFAELAATYPPKKVNDPASPIAAANGQYLLISREAYDAVGGHIKIANDLLEDVAMARLVKSSGRNIFFRYGGDAVRTRMYRSWSQMKEGWTKNLAILFPNASELALVYLAFFCVLVGMARFEVLAILGDVPWFHRGLPWEHVLAVITPLTSLVVLCGIAFSRLRLSHFSCAALGFFGLPIFSYLLLRSKFFYRKRRLHWKDRTYIYTADEIETLKNKRAAGTT